MRYNPPFTRESPGFVVMRYRDIVLCIVLCALATVMLDIMPVASHWCSAMVTLYVPFLVRELVAFTNQSSTRRTVVGVVYHIFTIYFHDLLLVVPRLVRLHLLAEGKLLSTHGGGWCGAH